MKQGVAMAESIKIDRAQLLLYDAAVTRLVDIALQEDIGIGDLTTEALVPLEQQAEATIVANASGVICGLPIAQLVFRQLGELVRWETFVSDGDRVQSGQTVAAMQGSAHLLLMGERTALNFLQRMSGVATLTRQFVEAVRGTSAVILDTRKTIPGWRLLDKYATAIGGAQNHRLRLDDMILIKENHTAIAGGIAPAVQRARAYAERYQIPVVVEVQSLSELQEVLSIGGVDRILLDNFSVEQVQEAVRLTAGRLPLEVSGGITLSTVRAYAETGVQYISVGALTHSASALDLSMEIVPLR